MIVPCHNSAWLKFFRAAEPHLTDKPQTSYELAAKAGVEKNRLAQAMTLAANCHLVAISGYRQTTRLVALYIRVTA